ncbi:hypothetical protein MP638_007273 [Amoeboaphelidium occidentale]|nr:hypothetical protein MP638_007273 [Amoeboaphelidium occidentale]
MESDIHQKAVVSRKRLLDDDQFQRSSDLMLPPMKLHHQDNKVVQDQYVPSIDASFNPFSLDIYSSAMRRYTNGRKFLLPQVPDQMSLDVPLGCDGSGDSSSSTTMIIDTLAHGLNSTCNFSSNNDSIADPMTIDEEP